MTFCTLLIACTKEYKPIIPTYDVTLNKEMPDGVKNISLRPALFFEDISGGWDEDKTFTYYCDSVTPPENIVAVIHSHKLMRIPEKYRLKPNTTYYWKMKIDFPESEAISETRSFITIDTSMFYNRVWNLYCILETATYNTTTAHNHTFYRANRFTLKPKAGRLTSFEVTSDSIINATYYLVPKLDIYPTKGETRFFQDSIWIIDLPYKLENFGHYRENELCLVLKDFLNDSVYIYTSEY